MNICHHQCFSTIVNKVIFYTISTLLFCTQPCFTMLIYITFTPISPSLHSYHYTSNCELNTDLSVVVPSYIMFLCYVHSSSCCIDNTSFVTTTTSTTINLFTPTSLHVVAPPCPSPTLLSVEAADDGVTSDFQHNYLHSFSYKAYCLVLHFTAVSHQYN